MTVPAADPAPWVHTSGARVADFRDPDVPQGGYTYRPRHGYSDHADRYVSPRDCPECAHECIAGCYTQTDR